MTADQVPYHRVDGRPAGTPRGPLWWWEDVDAPGGGLLVLCCRHGRQGVLSAALHQVLPDGLVTPSVDVGCCHHHGVLAGWTAADAAAVRR